MEPEVTWYAQSAVRIDAGGLRVYVDPYHLPANQPPADVILISHEHGDHLSPDDLAQIRTPATKVFASRLAAEQLEEPVEVLEPGQSAEFGGLRVRTIPAYTVSKLRPSGEPTHPKANGGLGLLLDLAEHSFYFAGDTDVVPEMAGIGPVDYAFLPVGGHYVMTPDEAAEAARLVQPSIAVPVHYGLAAGTVEDAQRFADLVPDQVRVWIPTSASGQAPQSS
ncbi:MAG TPA: MBL fold metallo-hydrolase [Thermomicrobiaceae bacterium]|nr:MBL fold metallo-hydrolase [Thermomicrobiaceae bacterium]HEX5328542.1 MBL fold metallo-hydrolase [Acetobacteraceae bacterium]